MGRRWRLWWSNWHGNFQYGLARAACVRRVPVRMEVLVWYLGWWLTGRLCGLRIAFCPWVWWRPRRCDGRSE